MLVSPTNPFRRRWTALIVVAGALSFPGLAVGAPVVDQQQALDLSSAALVGGSGGSGPQIMAQIVTSGMPGLLTEVDLPLGCQAATTILVEIRDAAGTPLPDVLAAKTLSGLPVPPDWRSVVLPTAPFIPADTPFAIVLSSPGTCGVRTSGLNADPYKRGDGWYQGPPNPPGMWVPGGSDVAFKTYVERICQVPALVGTAGKDAPATLARYGCSVGTVTRVHSLSSSKDEVISQNQGEGTHLAAGSTVDFAVSLGKPPCRVPDVRGRKLAKARSAIVRANCRVGVIRRLPSSKGLKGRVIRQRPVAGARRPYGARVKLVVGRGGRRL
jgi:PASTA domain